MRDCFSFQRNQPIHSALLKKTITNASKLLLLALVASLFAGCAATRRISGVAFGAGGAVREG
jgi:hypothetical protein